MNYKSIIQSSVSWISAKKIAWFISFFWISVPFLVLLPQIFEQNIVYNSATKPLALALYDVLFVVFFLGVIVLIQHALSAKNESVCEFSFRELARLVALVFFELFHIFFYGLHASFRMLQLLFLVASLLGLFFFSYYPSVVSFWLLYALLTGYFFFVIYNCLRLFFSTTLFCARSEGSFEKIISESWALTHTKFKSVVRAVILIGIVCFALYVFIVLALGAFTSLVLGFFFIDSVAMLIGFRVANAFAMGIVIIAYHFCVAEVYSQLYRHKESSTSIKRILAKRVLSAEKKTAKRSFANKKAKKKRRYFF